MTIAVRVLNILIVYVHGHSSTGVKCADNNVHGHSRKGVKQSHSGYLFKTVILLKLCVTQLQVDKQFTDLQILMFKRSFHSR